MFYFNGYVFQWSYDVLEKIKQALKSTLKLLLGRWGWSLICYILCPHFHKYLLSLFFFLLKISIRATSFFFSSSNLLPAAQCLFSGSSTKHHSTIPASVPSLLPLPPNTRLSLATPWILSSGPPLGFWDPSPAQPRKGTHSLRSLFPEDPSSPSS